MPSRLVIRLFVAALVMTCSAASALETIERPDFKRYFDEAGTDGTIVVYNLATEKRFIYNPDRARTGYLPSSTFQIFNSLAAIEAGIVQSVDGDRFLPPAEPFKVDGKAILPPICNTTVNLRVAFRNSCFGASQEIARQVGPDRMSEYLRESDYGNAAITGAPLDAFWFRGDLRITAEEQLRFLEKLWREVLPFSRQTQRTVKDIMFVEDSPQRTIRGKSGYVFSSEPEVGWWVGWSQHEGDAIIFALNIDLTTPEHFEARRDIVMKILDEAGV